MSETIQNLLILLFKHKVKILTVLVVTVATVAVGLLQGAPVYEATTTFLVKFGREYLVRTPVGDGSTAQSNAYRNREELINSEIEILRSRDLLERVILTIGVDAFYPVSDSITSRYWSRISKPLMQAIERLMTAMGMPTFFPVPERTTALSRSRIEQAIERFKTDLKVEAVSKSDVVRVAFQHPDAQIVARALNMLIDFFKEKHLMLFKESESLALLEKQVKVYRQKLEQSLEKLRMFQQTHEIFSHDKQRDSLLGQNMELDILLKATQSLYVELQHKFSSLVEQLHTIAETTPLSTEEDAIIQEARSRIFTLQLQEQKLLSRLKEGHPSLIKLRQELQTAKDTLKKRERDNKQKVILGKNTIYQDIKMEMIKTQADLRAQAAKIEVIKLQKNTVDKKLQSLVQKEQELHDLQRERDRHEKHYQLYTHKLEAARLSDEMDRQKIASIRVVQIATVPVQPEKTRKTTLIALGAFLGTLGGIALAFCTEYAGQSLNTPENAARRLGLPVLAAFAYEK